jgi:hypothetical protein
MVTGLYGSANPVDICFRLCVQGVENWMGQFHPQELVLLISDDFQQKDVKAELRKSFRQLRKRFRRPVTSFVWRLHDEMYFGNSKDSIGIQLADLCGYFIAKHLEGDDDPAAEGFYELIKDCIVFSHVAPQP